MIPPSLRERVALALGYYTCTYLGEIGWGRRLPGGFEHRHDLPPWDTDDGVAFSTLWPLILERSTPGSHSDFYLTLIDGKPSVFVSDEATIQADTWALVLCEAFLALVEREGKEPRE